MIHSVEDLKAIMFSPVELPAIDFSNYSLIIGQHIVLSTSFYVLDQNLDVGSEKVTLNLTLKVPEACYLGLSRQYYWGLYPKLSGTDIDVNVIYED